MICFSFPLGLSSIVRRTSIPTGQQIKINLGGDDDDDDHHHNSEDGSSTSGAIPAMNTNADIVTTADSNTEINSYDTIDALPHADHYRNLFSITSPEPKLRPTLEALHETSKSRVGSTIDLNSELVTALVAPQQTDVPSQVGTKPTINVVKFGWIVGVLVSLFGECLRLKQSFSS